MKYLATAVMLLSLIASFVAIQAAFQYPAWAVQFVILTLILLWVGFAASAKIED